MSRPIAVLAAPRLEPYPSDAVFGECRDCRREIMWSKDCPLGLPHLCVDCIAVEVIGAPGNETFVVLPSGRRALATSQIIPRLAQ